MSVYEQLKTKMDLGFDRDELLAKYQQERDKRMRTDFEDQFVRVDLDEHAEYLVDDPFTEVQARDPLDKEVEVLVLGGGWVGLMIAARLKEAGHDDLMIMDGAGDFGGVWYWNRYPGAACDIQSYLYLPLLEETGFIPPRRYSTAPEIFAHAQRIGKRYDLYPNALFHTWTKDMTWDEEASRWIVTTNRGDVIRARYVSLCTGSASRPRLPGIPGLDTFQGKTFHTSRWDYGYTGGDPESPMTKLADKRVAIIGTGATGVQVIPAVAADAGETFVFQRTPSPVGPRGDKPTDPEWVASLEPGWQEKLLREFDKVAAGQPAESPILKMESMLNMGAYVQQMMEHLDVSALTPDDFTELADLANHMTMEALRNHVDSIVTRPEHAEILKPWYRFMCKRPTFSDNYLEAFNRPNLTLVDVSASKGVDRITEKGVVANGVEHEVDCIIFASGFEITSSFDRRVGVPVHGVGGRSLYEHWADGMRTMHGTMSHGFPNLFIIGGLFLQSLSPNYITPIDSQARHVVHVLDALKARGATIAQPSQKGEDAFVEEQLTGEPSAFAINFGGSPESCTPGYYSQEGRPMSERRETRQETYHKGGDAYWEAMAAWRSEGELAGMEVR